MKALRNLVILGVIGYLAWNHFVPEPVGDRPPIVISNNPVRIEAQRDNKGRGTFEQGMFGMGRGWYHHHPTRGPLHLEAIVEGSTCGENARYDAEEIRVLTNGSAGTSSAVVISVGGFPPFTSLEVDPQGETIIRRDAIQAPYLLYVGTSEETLTQVRIGASTCSFPAGEGSITIVQKQ